MLVSSNTLTGNRFSGVFISSTGDALDNSQGNWHWYFEPSQGQTYSPRNITISGNTITNNGTSSYPSDLDKQQKLNNGVSVIAGNADTILVNGCNKIYSNGNLGVNNYTTTVLVANGNYWGTNQPVFPGNNISSYVLVKRYSSNSTCVAAVITVNTLITEDSTPALSGTIDDPNAKVTITLDGREYSADVKNDGTWGIADNIVSTLLPGTYDVSAKAKDSLGNVVVDSTTGELTILAKNSLNISKTSKFVTIPIKNR